MPVATLTKIRWSTLGPRQLALAERHDVHVVVDEHRHVEGAAEPAGHVEAVPAGHDRRVDGAAAAVLDRAGQPDADREQVGGVAAELVEQLARGVRRPRSSTASGPSATRMRRSFGRIRPVRSLTAMRTWEAPTSTPSTTRPLAAIANCDEGRPPVETASPTGPTSPSCMRASMRRPTVDRARPVIADSSVRVRGRPSRRIWNRSLATDDPRAVTCPSWPVRLMSVICPFFHNRRSKFPDRGRKGAPLSVVTAQRRRPAPRGAHDPAARSTD